MYIPIIVLTIIICILVFYSYSKEENHKQELNEQTDKLQQEKKAALIELDEYYQKEIINLEEEISKIKNGTLIEELTKENERLKDKLAETEFEKEENIKTLNKIHNEELESIFECCYEGLIAIENTFNKLNAPYNLERLINYHKSLTPMGQVLIVESEHLTESIESLIEWEKD